MSEDKNKELKPKTSSVVGTTAGSKKPAAAMATKSEGTDLSVAKPVATSPRPPAKPEIKSLEAKPMHVKSSGLPGIKPLRPISGPKEEDMYPSEDEEDEEDDASPLFVDESDGDELESEIAPDIILGATDTSERIILVVDEEGQRRHETVAIISQILPNAVIEVANDPEEALAMMEDGDFDTFVVNFLMPGYSSSPFVKAVANHPEHPLLIGFAADKMSDAVNPKKGLKIIPLKRLFDLDTSNSTDTPEGEPTDD